MTNTFKDKVDFIVRTDGLLKDYIENVVVNKIKAEMPDDIFKKMTSNHIRAAFMLKNIEPCSLKEFATAMRLSKAAASAQVERMVKTGMVQRETNRDNRREVILTVSIPFEKHINHVHAEVTNWFMSITEQLGMETFEKWYEVMTTLNEVLNKRIKTEDMPY
ncbi:MarR family transcriptional regulator [Desulfovibrio gilichinskyi]|uniref:Transcriptional regulator, MarR family n=1 Tax=Desulfovibrio gilichinskyi TaxID=1519643 RepID=A0A1X7DQZ0_9BACT|nr:MarR family transcriptional regulator [Desulfovibrio gilichinskyi]SMF19769.1 transcriptional regulator, MarR family [Desulfovibrio gilichinskyi]